MRALCRARAFLLEQFREQYFDRGRAGLQHSCQAHMPPELSVSSGALRAAAFFGAARDGLAALVVFRPTGADDAAVLLGVEGVLVAVRSAGFLATIILGRAGRLALVFVVLTFTAL